MTTTRQTRVLLVDDHEIMRDGLREVLQREGDFDVVGQAGDGAAAVRIAQQLRPDVVIMDVMMPLKNGIDACREITEMLPDTRVLILTASAEGRRRHGGGGRGRDRISPEVLGQGTSCLTQSETWQRESTGFRAPLLGACSRHKGSPPSRTVPGRSKGSQSATGRYSHCFRAGELSYAEIADVRSNQPLDDQKRHIRHTGPSSASTPSRTTRGSGRSRMGLLDDYQLGGA